MKPLNNILYYIIYSLFYVLSLLPLGVLYVFSDFMYLVVYKLVGYRIKVVRNNISSSFPDINDEERLRIEREFYHWFCDYMLETIKLLSISDRQLHKRFKVINAEEIIECFNNGQSCAAVLGHYCNWEWLSCVGIAFPKGCKMGLIYHPLYNEAFDRLFRKIRSGQPDAVPVPKKDILRYLLDYRRNGVMSLFGYIADQSPKWENIHLWLPFLGHDTPVFTGAERIIRKMNNAVFYTEMSRPRRGYYTCTFKLITKDPQSLPEHEVTRRFFSMLETTIRHNPQYYLWSHKRWKRTHEEFNENFEVLNGKVVHKH